MHGLPSEVRESDIRREFEAFGVIVDIRLVMDPRTRLNRGFAFITFETVEDADRAIKEGDGMRLHGKTITVEKVSNTFIGQYQQAEIAARFDSKHTQRQH